MLEELSLTKEIRVAYESVRDLKEKRDRKPRCVLQNQCIPWLCLWPLLHLQLMSFVHLALLLLLLPFLRCQLLRLRRHSAIYRLKAQHKKTRAGGNVQTWRNMILLGTTSLRISSSMAGSPTVSTCAKVSTGLRAERKCTLITTLGEMEECADVTSDGTRQTTYTV
jgi:hypothetical protein